MKRLALGIAVVAVLVVPAALVAVEPGNAAGGQPSSRSGRSHVVTLVAPSSALTGSKVSFSGRVKNAPRGTQVKIQLRTGRTWHTRRVARTGTGGRYATSLVVAGHGPATYRAYTSRKHVAPQSATIRLAILRPESVQVHAGRTNAEQNSPLTVSVATTPAQVGGTVQLQTRSGSGAWQAAGTTTLTRVGTATFHPQPATTGSVQYRVLKPRHAYDAGATSAAIAVAVQPKGATFGQLMHPGSTQVLDPAVATWSFLAQPPSWSAHNALIRWDTAGAFDWSLPPEPSAYPGSLALPGDAATTLAEFNNGNSSLQTADVAFDATGTTFAIRYLTFGSSSVMVWIDGHPIAAAPVAGVAPVNAGQLNWIQVTLPRRGTVQVRFAGPDNLIGIDHDASVPLTVTAAPYPFTLGVVSDSYFDSSLPYKTYEGSGAAVLHTRTGFRIWDLAQGGTGYLSNAGNGGYPGHYASEFGSDARMARLKDAPIDALLVNGSINDAGYDNDAYASAVNRFLDRVAQLRPGLPVVILGLEPVTAVAGADPAYFADLDAKNELLQTIAAKHANVVGFINPYDEDWLTGTGSTASPQGDGNQDLYVGPDHIHLSPAGQAYYQDLVAQRLAVLPATLK